MSLSRAVRVGIAIAVGTSPLWWVMGREVANQRVVERERAQQVELARQAEHWMANGEVAAAIDLLREQPGDDPAAVARRHAIAAMILRAPRRLESTAQLREVQRLRDGVPPEP